MRKIDTPWERGTIDPVTTGFPWTVRMKFKDGYTIFLTHYTGLRAKLAFFGNYLIPIYCGYITFQNVEFKELLDPPRVGYSSVYAAVQNSGFLHGTLSELVYFVSGSTLGYWSLALDQFLNGLPQIVPWVALAVLSVLVFRLALVRVTPVRMTLNRARFGWLAVRGFDRNFLTDFMVQECPRALGHAGRVLQHFNIEDQYLNTYRIYAIYGTNGRIKVADVCGQAKAEAACEKLRRINDFLNTQIDRQMPIDTER